MWEQLALGGAASRGLWSPDPPTGGSVQVEVHAQRLAGMGQVSGAAFQARSDGFVQFCRRTKWEKVFDRGRTQDGFQEQPELQLRQAWVCQVPPPRLKDLGQVV